MKPNKQNADFLYIGERLLAWYRTNSRALPWRETKEPYKVWISEIVLQQTQVKQGTQHYIRFVERFPDVQNLAAAETDEVLLYWKGLGYYTRALNLHKAAKQIVDEFDGRFPDSYSEILKLKGVGKYTAAAIASICFGEKIPAVDGNFYRVLSRLFADVFDISHSSAFTYFSELALRMMPAHSAGDFNQAMMDLGSEICRPRNPDCANCPLNADCLAFQTGRVHDFPVKTKKVKVQEAELNYFFVVNDDKFLVRRRGNATIWKNLYEFPDALPDTSLEIIRTKQFSHKLSHRNLTITVSEVHLNSIKVLKNFAAENGFIIVNQEESDAKSFPAPLGRYISEYFEKLN